MPHPYCTWPDQGRYRRGGGGVEGGPVEKRGLIIISIRVPEHPRFTGLTHATSRSCPRGMDRFKDRETWEEGMEF